MYCDCRSRMLRKSTGIDEAGDLRWDLALILLLCWVLVYFCIWKGPRGTGKVLHILIHFTPTDDISCLNIMDGRVHSALKGLKFGVLGFNFDNFKLNMFSFS